MRRDAEGYVAFLSEGIWSVLALIVFAFIVGFLLGGAWIANGNTLPALPWSPGGGGIPMHR